jgi:hypothetical protein
MTHTINVLRLKTAKAIIDRCYVADKTSSCSFSPNNMSVRGINIDAIAIKVANGWDVTISSSVYELSTLQRLVNDVFIAIAAHKAAN